jgi:hypothetical protein
MCIRLDKCPRVVPCLGKATHYPISRFALTGQKSNALDNTSEHRSATPENQLNDNLYCGLPTVKSLVLPPV